MTGESGNSQASARVRMGRPGVAGAGRDRFGLTGISHAFDPRIVAIRPDLADVAVAGQYFAPHYAAPMMRSGALPVAAMRAAPAADAEQTSELLFGEGFALLDITGGWAWGYSLADHYVGYVAAEALAAPIAPTHRVAARESIVHSTPDAASGGSAILPFGALLMGAVEGEWLATSHGYVALGAVEDIDCVHGDPAAIAESLAGTPYVWGGRTAKGIDCSGLVQLAWAAAGVQLPRDSDLQLAALGDDRSVVPGALQRGDLVFFPGHVGIMADSETIIHASQHWQGVHAEPLADLVERTRAEGHDPAILGCKRPR